jgi:NAD(P)-dependent dehydrogenase (short-subunit alcohol dehydrogenase family)
MIGDLKGKVAFITGAASGIGLGIARAAAEAGMKVAMADIDVATLEQSADELAKTQAKVLAVPLDVADPAAWAVARDRVESELGPVQLLCNNAGVSTLGMTFDETTPEIWNRVVGINLNSVYYGIRTFLEGMRAAGGGHIVNTSSMGAALGVFPNLSAYITTKAGVIGLSETLSAEFAPQGIGVSVLLPGAIRSRLWRTSRAARGLPDIETPPEDFSGQTARAPGDPDKVGRYVLEAVRNNDLYIYTDQGQRPQHERHLQAILAGYDRVVAREAAGAD